VGFARQEKGEPAMTSVRSNFALALKVVFAAAIAFAGMVAVDAIAPTAEAAKPAVIRDNCNQTSGDGMGHECPNATDLLIRPKYGESCADWICCPANADGQTFDCTKATNPTRVGSVKDRFKDILGPRADKVDPGPSRSNPKGHVTPNVKDSVRTPN
jgi:hypothetical protein